MRTRIWKSGFIDWLRGNIKKRATGTSRRPGLGVEFATEMDRAASRIAKYPHRWPAYFERFRRVRLRRFPYSLYYHVVDSSLVLVLAVAHGRRRPGYWRRRLSY